MVWYVPRDEKCADEKEDAHEEGVGHEVAPDGLKALDRDSAAPVGVVDAKLAGVLVRLHWLDKGREVRPVASAVPADKGVPLDFTMEIEVIFLLVTHCSTIVEEQETRQTAY